MVNQNINQRLFFTKASYDLRRQLLWHFMIHILSLYMELDRKKNRLWALDVLKSIFNETLMRIRRNKKVFMFIWINISWLFQHMSSLCVSTVCHSLFSRPLSITLFERLTQSQSCSEWRSSCGAHEVQWVDVFSFIGVQRFNQHKKLAHKRPFMWKALNHECYCDLVLDDLLNVQNILLM